MPLAFQSKVAVVLVTAVAVRLNGHVNNARYVEMALSYLPPEFPIREIRVQYIRQAMLGEVQPVSDVSLMPTSKAVPSAVQLTVAVL